MPNPDAAPRNQPGPEPERLKIEGPWGDAVKRALRTPRPPEGWPNAPKQKRDKDGANA